MIPAPAAGRTLLSYSVPVGTSPAMATFNPSNGYVYVSNFNSANVSVLNGTTLVASLPAGTNPYGSVFDAKTGNLYVSNVYTNNVTVYNGTHKVGTITVGTAPGFPAYDPRTGDVYIPDAGSSTVSVLSGISVATTINVGTTPVNATFDPTHGFVDVLNSGSGTVSVINGTKVVATIPVGSKPVAAIYDPAKGWEYVSNSGGHNVTILNGTKIVGAVGVGSGPEYGGYDPANKEVYIANQYSNNVSILNGTRVVASVNTSSYPSGASYDPVDGHMYVPIDGVREIVLLNGSQVIQTVGSGYNACCATYDDTTGEMFVLNIGSANVSVLQYQYEVTFSEQGLPAGSPWSVTMGTGASNSSTAPQLNFSLTDGTYVYTVTTPNLTYAAPSGSVQVDEQPVTVVVLFSLVTFPVNFTETGLPLDTIWFVTLAGMTITAPVSSTPVLSFREPNGTAPYRVGDVPGWTTSPYVGNVQVRGAPVLVTVPWTFSEFPVEVEETGLPAGSGWWVNLTGGASTFSTARSLSFLEPNGSYDFVVGSRNSSFQALPGTFFVSGRPENLSVAFTLVVYLLSFREHGLPAATPWSVQLPSGILHSTTPWANLSVPNGTYPYRIAPIAGWKLGEYSGTVTVAGFSSEQNLSWQEMTYRITFSESGLPNGTRWSVAIGGESNGSTGSIAFDGFPNGTFSYSVGAPSGYSATQAIGRITVNGLPVSQLVLFSPAACGCPAQTMTPPTFLGIPLGLVLVAVAGIAAVATLSIVLRARKHRGPPTKSGPGP